LSHPLGELGVTYTVHIWLVGKCVVDFLLVLIKLFRQLSWLRRYEQILVESVLFERGWVTLSANFMGRASSTNDIWRKFQAEGGSYTNEFWRQKTRVPGLSRGVVCVILRFAVLIQYRRVTHRHTHRQTDTR